MKKAQIKKWSIVVLTLVAAYTLIGFFALPPLVKWLAQKKLSERLQRTVTIEKIRINPYSLTAAVEGFAVASRDGKGQLAAFDSLFANLQGSSLFRGGMVISEVRLAGPRLHIVRLKPGSYNFSDLIPAAVPPAGSETPSDPLRFSVNNIQVTDGQVEFIDDYLGKRHDVGGITLTLPFISNFDPDVEIFVEPRLTAEVNGKPFSLRGRSLPFDARLETVLDIDLSDVDVPYYLAYAPQPLPAKVSSALLDVKASLHFAVEQGQKARLELKGDVALKTVSIEDGAANPLLSFPRLDIAIAPSDLLRGELHLARVSLSRPEITLQRETDGTLNIEKVLPPPTADTPAESAKKPAAVNLSIDEITLDGGRALFRDLVESPSFETTLYPIDLKIAGFSNQKERSADVTLTLISEAQELLALEGRFSVDPPTTSGRLSLKGASLAKYAPYYAAYARFAVDSGRLDVQTDFQVEAADQPPKISLSGLSTRLYELQLKRPGETKPFLDIPEFVVDRTEVDVNRRTVAVGEIRSQNGAAAVKRLKIGDLDVQGLFQAPAAPATPAEEGPSPWQVTVAHLLIDQYTVEGEDQTFAEPVRMTLDQVRLEVGDFSTAAGHRANVDLSWRYNKKGTLAVTGPFAIDPPAGELALKMQGYEPVWFQKYFEDRVQVMATGGRIDARGNIVFAMDEKKGLSLTYRGDASVSDFKSVERAGAAEFVSFKKLAVSGADISVNPTTVNVKRVDLDRFFTRLVLTRDGRLNVQETVRAPKNDKAPKGDKAAGETVPVRIAEVNLKNGRVKFLDQFVAPGYATTLGSIDGHLRGLTTDKTKNADIEIAARLDEQAPFKVTGKVNPLADELYADVAIKFDGMELSPLSPYSGKYAGYKIQKGKLSLDLNYVIENKTLKAKNYVHLDQFDFGSRVESKDATTLPVTLAVALLKDRSGKITLDLPVSGRLDDPEFSIGGVILKMVVNLLVKAATSPFALVGAILGGGEEMSQIEFDYGSTLLNDTADGKLSQLAKALYDRPALKLDVSGYADPTKDRESLAEARFEDKLKAQKLKRLAAQGSAPGSLADVTIAPDEVETYLIAALNEAQIPIPPQPASPKGQAKAAGDKEQAPPTDRLAELQRLLKETVRIGDDDLRALARDRALAVKGYLLQNGKVEAERVFLVDPEQLTPPPAEGLKNSRVVLGLK